MKYTDLSLEWRGRALAFGAAVAMVVVLAGCAQRAGPAAMASGGNDDDAYCQANSGPVGSPPYVACRKDRDVIRGNAVARSDRAQRNLADWMLNHP